MTPRSSTPLSVPPFRDLYNLSIPELWLSALLRLSVVGTSSQYESVPLVYEIDEKVKAVVMKSSGLSTATQQCRSNLDNRDKWVEALKTAFSEVGIDVKNIELLADAVEEELMTQTEAANRKRKVKAAIPITPISGILQNQAGVVGSDKYVDFGKAVEEIYEIGRILSRDGKSDSASASERLLSALISRRANDKRLAAVDNALKTSLASALEKSFNEIEVFYSEVEGKLTFGEKHEIDRHEFNSDEDDILENLKFIDDMNCYVWFYKSWNKLTSPEWVNATPHRRWTDWLVTITRLGVGTSFLFRANWVIEAVKVALNQNVNVSEVQDRMLAALETPILDWVDRSQSLSGQRDVNPQLRKLLCTSKAIEQELKKADFVSAIGDDESIEKLKSVLESSQSLTKQLEYALSNLGRDDKGPLDLRSKSIKPVHNTIRDSLVDRTSDGNESESSDYYALMRSESIGNRTLTYFDPLSEVVALIASLACDSPTSMTTLGDVRRQFQKLGFQPSQNELRFLLERAGLCRAEADASLQVVVSSALKLEELL